MIIFIGCKNNIVKAPAGTVPNRGELVYNAFGGHITVTTMDSLSYEGELIGMRNDSVIVLGASAYSIDPKKIARGRVVVYAPMNYGLGYILALPSLFLFTLSADEFGQQPALFGFLFSSVNIMGASMAIGTEAAKVNYIDWTKGWKEVMKYSRFPYEVPANIKLSELKRK